MKSDLGGLIAGLLRNNNRVSLPGMGAFVANYKPAIIDEETLVVTPPAKEISFSKEETWNDRLIENLVAEQENISAEEAAKVVDKYVEEVREALNKEEKYLFAGLGMLIKDGWNFNFEIEEGVNLLPDAFGLESITLKKPAVAKEPVAPSTSVTPKKTSPQKPSLPKQHPPVKPSPKPSTGAQRSRRSTSIIWIVAISILAIAAVSLWLFTDIFTPAQLPTPLAVSQPSPVAVDTTIADSASTDTTEKANVEEVINTQTEKKRALYYEEPKTNSAEKTFYIIAGSFTKEGNAERLKSMLEKKGFKPEILTVDGPIYRVSMFSFTNKNRALEELSRLREENKQMNIWLLGL